MSTLDKYESKMSDKAIIARKARGEALQDYELNHYKALVEQHANRLRNKHFNDPSFLVDIGISLAKDGLSNKKELD